jgi:hypothetical protein
MGFYFLRKEVDLCAKASNGVDRSTQDFDPQTRTWQKTWAFNLLFSSFSLENNKLKARGGKDILKLKNWCLDVNLDFPYNLHIPDIINIASY